MQLAGSMKKILKVSLSLTLICLAFYAGACLYGWRHRFENAEPALRSLYLKSSPEKGLANIWPQVVEDSKIISDSPLFNVESRGKKDASPLLNPIFVVDVQNASSWPTLPQYYVDELQQRRDSWQDWSPDFQKNPVDLTWFEKLEQFDFWNYDQDAFDRRVKTIDNFEFSRNLEVLGEWVKLRLLQAKQQHRQEDASVQIHKLAHLLMTTEDLQLSMEAIMILGVERTFFEKRNNKPSSMMTADLQSRARRFFYATSRMLDPIYSADFQTRVSQLPTGICTIVSSGIKNYLYAGVFLKDLHESKYQWMDELVKSTATHCRNGWFRRAWADPSYPVAFKPGDRLLKFPILPGVPSEESWWFNLLASQSVLFEEVQMSSPSQKHAYGYAASMLVPDFFRFYKER